MRLLSKNAWTATHSASVARRFLFAAYTSQDAAWRWSVREITEAQNAKRHSVGAAYTLSRPLLAQH